MPDVPVIAHIAELWRYPVKSMRGEQVDSLEMLPDGIAADRRYAFVSSGAPAGKPRLTSRERAALLRYSAYVSGNETRICTPEGLTFSAHDPALLTHLEQNLPQQHRIALEHEPGAAPYTDVRPISVVSTQALATVSRTLGSPVDPRRFRSNLVLTFTAKATEVLTGGDADQFPENALTGCTLQIGATCRLRLLERIPRCRVVTLDPDTSEPDPTLMKHLDRHHGGRLGIYAAVVTHGPLRVGDPVLLA
jgi:uncharacterized protein